MHNLWRITIYLCFGNEIIVREQLIAKMTGRTCILPIKILKNKLESGPLAVVTWEIQTSTKMVTRKTQISQTQ